MKRLLYALPAAAAVVVLGATSASAATWNDARTTTGAKAVCTIVTSKKYVANDTAGLYCNITDTSNDAKSVYVSWWIDAYPKLRLTDTEGPGKTVSRSGTTRGDASIGTVRWKVCRNVPNGVDNCSSTVAHSP